MANQPLQQYDTYKIKAAEKFAASARGAMYPSFSLYGNLGSSYIAANTPNYIPSLGVYSPSISKVNVGGQDYFVQVPSVVYTKNGTLKSDPFGQQLSDNFRQSVGLSVSVPIFNGGSAKTNYEKSKLNITSLQLQKNADDQTLKQNIYSAYNAAMIALEKFNASAKAVAANQQTYDYANKRFNVGMLGTFDLITSQNNLFSAKLQYALNQFDYVFKMKVLEFYRGQGLKL
ncbi:MAG: TolC family protein [Ferruginibacter sp.]